MWQHQRRKKVEYDTLSFVWELMRMIEKRWDRKIEVKIEVKI